MNKRKELVDAHKEIIMNLSVDELREVFSDNDMLDDFETIVLSMPKKTEMDTLRINLGANLTSWIDYDSLSEGELLDQLEYLLNIVNEKEKKNE